MKVIRGRGNTEFIEHEDRDEDEKNSPVVSAPRETPKTAGPARAETDGGGIEADDRGRPPLQRGRDGNAAVPKIQEPYPYDDEYYAGNPPPPGARRPTAKEITNAEDLRKRRIKQGYPAMIRLFRQEDAWAANPDQKAREAWNSYKSGVPMYLMDNPEMKSLAETRAKMRDAREEYRFVSKPVVDWLGQGYNLDIAHDDAVSLSRLGTSLTKLAGNMAPREDRSVRKAFQGGWSDFFKRWAQSNEVDAAAPGKPFEPGVKPVGRSGNMSRFVSAPSVPEAADNTLRSIDKWQAGWQRALSEALDPGEYLRPSGVWGQFGHDILRSSAYTLYSVGQSAAIMAAASALAPVTGGGSLGIAAASLAGAFGEAKIQGSGVYFEALENGMGEEEARSAANEVMSANFLMLTASNTVQNGLAFGAPAGALGRGAGKMSGRAAAYARLKLGKTAAGAMRTLGGFAANAGIEGMEEAAQDLIDFRALGTDTDWDRVRWSFLIGAGSGGIFHGAGTGLRGAGRALSYTGNKLTGIVRRGQEIQNTETVAPILGEAVENVKESKTAQRLPEAAEDFVRQVTEGQIDTVWIDGDVLASYAQAIAEERGGLDGNGEINEIVWEASVGSLREEIGFSDAEMFSEALDLGTPVEVDAAKAVVLMGTKEKYAKLKDHVTFTPNGVSAANAAEEWAALRETAQNLMEDFKDEQERIESEGGAAAKFARGIKEAFLGTDSKALRGKTASGAYAELLAARLAVKARDMGIPFEELAGPGAVRVERNGNETRIALRRTIGAAAETVVLERFEQRGEAAENRLNADEAAWAAAVDAFVNHTLDKSRSIRVMTTPLVFSLAGADVLPVYMNYNTVKNSLKKKGSRGVGGHSEGHGLTPEILKQIPRALADPIMIFQSDSQATNLVAMLELKDADGKDIVSVLRLDKINNDRYEATNALVSVYGKDDSYRVDANTWFTEQALSGALYINTEKASAWATGAGLSMWSDTFTPERLSEIIPNQHDLDKLLKENQGLYQEGDDSVRGEAGFTKDEAIITLFESADRSTFLHEMGHWFLEDLRDMAGLDGIAPRVAEDWNTVAAWLGVAEDSEKWRVASEEDRAKMWKNAHEKFAASFEQYCFEGKAPSNALKKAFRAFKKWLLDIYKAVAGIRYRDADGNRVAFQINDDIRGVLGRMLAAEEAAENAADEMGVTEVAEAADRKGKKGKKGKAGSGIIDRDDLSNAEAERVGNSVFQAESGRSVETADPSELLISEDGSPTFGIIDEETARQAGITPGEVRVNVGMIRHTEKEHGEQIRNAGYDNVESMFADVAANYNEIREGTNGSVLLVKSMEGTKSPSSAVELIPDEGIYRGKTVWMARNDYLENRKLLSTRSATPVTGPASDLASLPGTPNSQGKPRRWSARQESNLTEDSISQASANNKDDLREEDNTQSHIDAASRPEEGGSRREGAEPGGAGGRAGDAGGRMPPLRGALDAAIEEQVESAKERALSELMRGIDPANEAAIRAETERLAPEVRKELLREPVYAAINEMNGNPAVRLSLDEVSERWGDGFIEALPDNILDAEGLSADAAAASFGFGSADEFINALSAANDIEAEIARRAGEAALRNLRIPSVQDAGRIAADVMAASDEDIDRAAIEAEIYKTTAPEEEFYGESDIIDRGGQADTAEAERVGNSVVVVTGDEFGDFDLSEHGSDVYRAELKRLREEALKYYMDVLRKRPAKHNDNRIKEVLFSRRGGGKAISSSANPDKLKLIRKLPELIENSIVDGEPEQVKHPKNHPGVKQFWWLKSQAILDNRMADVRILVEDYGDGNIYYNHHLDYSTKQNPPSGISGTSETDALPPSENGLSKDIIPSQNDNVNDVGSNNPNTDITSRPGEGGSFYDGGYEGSIDDLNAAFPEEEGTGGGARDTGGGMPPLRDAFYEEDPRELAGGEAVQRLRERLGSSYKTAPTRPCRTPSRPARATARRSPPYKRAGCSRG
ncbi:hypothetical protein FACS1894167_04840 [Synergistales bacterium]|nr:hypothetical protein FACS1894167_04840 [Synergistales bacterium]